MSPLSNELPNSFLFFCIYKQHPQFSIFPTIHYRLIEDQKFKYLVESTSDHSSLDSSLKFEFRHAILLI